MAAATELGLTPNKCLEVTYTQGGSARNILNGLDQIQTRSFHGYSRAQGQLARARCFESRREQQVKSRVVFWANRIFLAMQAFYSYFGSERRSCLEVNFVNMQGEQTRRFYLVTTESLNVFMKNIPQPGTASVDGVTFGKRQSFFSFFGTMLTIDTRQVGQPQASAI